MGEHERTHPALSEIGGARQAAPSLFFIRDDLDHIIWDRHWLCGRMATLHPRRHSLRSRAAAMQAPVEPALEWMVMLRVLALMASLLLVRIAIGAL